MADELRKPLPELRERILAALDEIKDPCSLAAGTPLGLSEMGLVKELVIGADGAIDVSLRLTSPFCHMIGFFKTEAIRRIGELPGVTQVSFQADNGLDWSPNDIAPAARSRREVHLRRMEERLPAAS